MQHEMHITAIPYPSVQEKFVLDDEIELVKASLLYADKVLLFSIIPTLIYSLPEMADDFDEDLISQQEISKIKDNVTKELIGNVQNTEDFEKRLKDIQPILKDKNTNLESAVRDELDRVSNRMSDTFLSAWNDFKINLGVNKYDPAIKSGLLEIYSLSKTEIPDNTFPLLDENITKLFKHNKEERKIQITETELEKLTQISFAFDIFKRLPNFNKATISEILDIRESLEKPLIRFRSAMIDISENIRYEPWNENFKNDVEKQFRKIIEPSILEIEEECKTNKYLLELVNTFTENPLEMPIVGEITGAFISKLSSILNISAQAIGLAVGTGVVAYKAFKKWKEKTKNIEANQMFFYYRAGKLINK